MDNRICFPFTAAVGQNDVREALLLNLIDPSIGGVLIDGERGSGKSTLARSIAPLCAGPFVEAPLSVSEGSPIPLLPRTRACSLPCP